MLVKRIKEEKMEIEKQNEEETNQSFSLNNDI
jgi:hypothetical protein